MNKLLLYSTVFILTLWAGNGPAFSQNGLPLVPEPAVVKTQPGSFNLSARTKIVFSPSDQQVRQVSEQLKNQLSSLTGIAVAISSTDKKEVKGAVMITLNQASNPATGDEGYTLDITPRQIRIAANKPAGLFYGVQTLLQLIPPQAGTSVPVPCASITDYPRFAWRGLMLDVSRHFFNKQEVEQFIDQMAQYKYNTFHWHLADDNGWRIEIKSYPRLTSVGAWSIARTGKYGSFDPAGQDEKPTYGGFYTQDDIREIVQYARDRFVTIVPEVDVPAHSRALVAAYPEFSCTGTPTTVFAGTREDIGDNVLCVGNEHTFEMLDTVFGELASLFPGQYIHVGGDEANRTFWQSCPKCQERMKTENLKSPEELQSYFTKRISRILASKGKKLIGWDEILEGGLAPDATVMSWRGTEGGIAAAKAGHPVVMSPTQYCYFDYMQGEPAIERYGWAHLRISQVYRFNPVPEGVNPAYILGGQGNIWTEMIPNFRRVEYMTWPRAMALCEVLWSPGKDRNWDAFVPRLEAQFPRFKQAGVNYAPSLYDPDIDMVTGKDGTPEITFATEIKGLDIYYTFDCTFPDQFSPKYENMPVAIPKGASDVWAISYRNGKPAGRLLVISLDDLKKRAGK